MSYRTKVNGIQIFGNNEYYPEWLEFIKSQGIKVNEAYNYKGEIVDFMEALEVIEKITLRLTKERGSRVDNVYVLFDFSNIVSKVESDSDDKYRTSLFDEIKDVINNSYAFMPYQFYMACKDKLENDHVFSRDGHFECYRLKDGESLMVEAN